MVLEKKRDFIRIGILFTIFALLALGYNNARYRESDVEPKRSLPQGFVYLDEVIPDAEYDIRYYGEHNFVGRKIDGYLDSEAIMTVPAAEALKKMHEDLKEQGLGLKIYDAYRPTQAVDHFVRWAKDPNDTKMKEEFYPNIDKSNLFAQGYIAKKSGHSRGSTVDLTIVRFDTKQELDMGSAFDLLDPISSHDTPLITNEQRDNRKLLRTVMEENGFRAYYKEWWHYTLVDEPYPEEYFNFPVQ